MLATLDSETIEVYVDDQGQVPILLLPDQGVRIHSVEAASWVPLADTGRTKKRE